MTVLYLNLVIVFLLAFGARYLSTPVFATTIYSPVKIKPNRYLTILAMVALILVSGLRTNIGDTFFIGTLTKYMIFHGNLYGVKKI